MALITFDTPNEFLEELETAKEAGEAISPVVRYSTVRKPVDDVGEMEILMMIITAVVGSDLWRVEYCCGDFWGNDPNERTEHRFADMREDIRGHCSTLLGLKFGAGRYEEG